jgi:hypothetical protein
MTMPKAKVHIKVGFVLTGGIAHAGTPFASATVAPGCNGSKKEPFNSRAAWSGDKTCGAPIAIQRGAS